MATEEGSFLPTASTEQEDEEANCSARLSKGIWGRVNVTAVSEEVVPKNCQIVQRS